MKTQTYDFQYSLCYQNAKRISDEIKTKEAIGKRQIATLGGLLFEVLRSLSLLELCNENFISILLFTSRGSVFLALA